MLSGFLNYVEKKLNLLLEQVDLGGSEFGGGFWGELVGYSYLPFMDRYDLSN